MNMNKALQNLYHAVSNETTTKVNISKLLVDIHYAITGKESENKNNWSKIVNSMADNWPEGGGGGGGSSDFSTAEVTLNLTPPEGVSINESYLSCDFYYPSESHNYTIPSFPADENNKCNIVLYRGYGYVGMIEAFDDGDNHYYLDYETASFSGGAIYDEETGVIVVTGNCTITGSLVLGD